MLRRSFARVVTTVAVFGLCVPSAWTLEPPTREQKATMLRDGSLAARVAAALEHGNHRVAPSLANRIFDLADAGKRELAATAKVLPSTGNREVFAILIEF